MTGPVRVLTRGLVGSPRALPLLSRALAVRAVFRAAPPGFLLLFLALVGVSQSALAVCASLAVSFALTPFVERLAARSRGWAPLLRCPLEAGVVSALLHASALVNAAWLAEAGLNLQARLDAAVVDGQLSSVLLPALVAGWLLAAPSGVLAFREERAAARRQAGPSEFRFAAGWLLLWSAPVAVSFAWVSLLEAGHPEGTTVLLSGVWVCMLWLVSAVGLVGLSFLDGLAALLVTDDGVGAGRT